MQLVKQELLHFKDGKSDKVYEVELYHIQGNEYVVNFRYGRRGATLREGTKTVFPVQKEQAEKVFDDLVSSKTKKGYQQVQNYDDTVTQVTTAAIPSFETSGARPVVLNYLQRIAKGDIPQTNWKLSRIIWRAGELEIEEAIKPIKDLLPTLDEQGLYSAVWTLGRIGNVDSNAVLKNMPVNESALHHNIHLGALINSGEKKVLNVIENALPLSIQTAYASKQHDQLGEELTRLITSPHSNKPYLLKLYYLTIQDKVLKPHFLKALAHAQAIPGTWKYLRYIYKVAEMIKDGETFGAIARLVNVRPKYFQKNSWTDQMWIEGQKINIPESLKSSEPKLAFSNSTKDYFIKRTLRRLRKAGIDKMESYCQLASGILISYTEEDAATQYEQVFYSYDWESRTSSQATHTYPPMTSVPYFYYILFAQGNRFQIPSNKIRRFYNTSGALDWTSREDSFPELWNRYPIYAVKVLARCQQRDAMNFAFKVLESRSDLEQLLTFDYLAEMVSNRFTEVLEFSLEYIRKKHDPKQPHVTLIINLIKSGNEKAIQLSIELMNKNAEPFTQDVSFIKEAILSQNPDLHNWLRANIKEAAQEKDQITNVIDHCLTSFKNWKDDNYNPLPSESLVTIYPEYLKTLSPESILELIDHPHLQVQLFGAKLINLNERKAEEWPDEILMKLLTSEQAVIREEGVKLFARLTDQQLIEKTELIVDLASSSHADLREQARPIIGRLAPTNKAFGEDVLFGLYDVLLDTHEDEEMAPDVYQTIETHLLDYIEILLPQLDEMTASHQREVHLLTLHLLENHTDVTSWSVAKMARLGAHDMRKIRDKVHHYFDTNVERVKNDRIEAINILDTDWEETRQFGREYFDKHFGEQEWDPELIIALCDNVRPETQAYGTRILGQYFKEEHGSKYLVALSEHPDPIIELYSTNYLNKYAYNNSEILEKLKPYFVRTLSAINTRRVAKLRVFNFLEKQAAESEAYAKYVTNILNELIGTIVVRENENYVSLLYALKQKYASLDINIENVPLEIR